MSFLNPRLLSGLLCGLAVLTAGVGCSRVDCPDLCKRVRQCEGQVSNALVARQPSQSPFMKTVRKKLPARMVGRLVKSCPERCDALAQNTKWKKKLQACAAQKSCDDFARCIAPALEP